MRIKQTFRIFFISFLVFCGSLISFPNGAAKTYAQTVGQFEIKQGIRILHLSGSYYQMGYDHGYLIGNDIMSFIEQYLIDYLLRGNVSSWATSVQLATTKMDFGVYEDEIRGMYDGVVASSADIYVDALHRNLTIGDLKVWNTTYDIGLLRASCTSFSVWGSAAGPAGVLQGRNMDYPYDTVNAFAASKQIIITYHPSGKQRFMGISWPGFIGAGSSMNESGLALTTNIGDGPIDTQFARTKYTPALVLLRRAIENPSGSGDLLSQAFSELGSGYYTPSIIVQVSQPRGRGTYVSQVFEMDTNGRDARSPTGSNPYIFAANHFVQRYTPTPSNNNTRQRWSILTSRLPSLITSGNNIVDQSEAITLLRDLSNANSLPTLLSVYFRPESLSFDISLPIVTGQNPARVTEAPFVTPVTFNWSDLFSNAPATPTPAPSIPGDANGDGRVNGSDYIIWLNYYGKSASGPSQGDFNNDNRVNGSDYIIWLNYYGT